MDDFFTLEKKCKQLRKKKLLKVVGYIFIIILIVIGGFFAYQYFNTKNHSKKIETNIKPKITKIISKKEINNTKITQPKSTQKKDINNTKVKVKIISTKKEVNKTKTMQSKQKKEIKKVPILEVKIDFNKITEPKIEKKAIIKKKVIPKEQKKVEKKEIKKSKPKKIIKNENISFEKAFKLATLYYNNGDYQNSMKWCKMASKIDSQNPAIWKLYALNLDKIGQTKKAIEVLQTYLKYKDSLELRYLLQRLKK